MRKLDQNQRGEASIILTSLSLPFVLFLLLVESSVPILGSALIAGTTFILGVIVKKWLEQQLEQRKKRNDNIDEVVRSHEVLILRVGNLEQQFGEFIEVTKKRQDQIDTVCRDVGEIKGMVQAQRRIISDGD